jgi:FMN-dependent oxidoreductase (nitrilotriacetate monooxygenase family)
LQLTALLAGRGLHPASWRLSAERTDLRMGPLQTWAKTAERGKLDAVLFGSPIGGPQLRASGYVDRIRIDTLPLMASCIALTSHIGLGAMLLPRYAQPYNAARIFATLDHLSSGRAAWIANCFPEPDVTVNYAHLGPRADAAASFERTREFVDVTRKLWDSWEDAALLIDKATGRFADPDKVHRIDHDGTWFKVRGPLNVPRPRQGQPVIVVTDPQTEQGRDLAAQTADVLLIHADTPDSARTLCRDMHRRVEAAGRPSGALRILANIMPILGPTPIEARRRANQLYNLVTPPLAAALVADWLDAPCMRANPAASHNDLLSAIWPEHRAAWPSRGLDAGMQLREAAQQVTVAQTGPRFVGDAEALADMMQEWMEQKACDGFNVVPAALPDDLDSVVDTLIPLLRQRKLVRDHYIGSTLREHLGLSRPESRYTPNAATGARDA